jgi:hypothetical protein
MRNQGRRLTLFHLFQLESRGGCNAQRALFSCWSFRSPPPLPTIPFAQNDLAISQGGKGGNKKKAGPKDGTN